MDEEGRVAKSLAGQRAFDALDLKEEEQATLARAYLVLAAECRAKHMKQELGEHLASSASEELLADPNAMRLTDSVCGPDLRARILAAGRRPETGKPVDPVSRAFGALCFAEEKNLVLGRAHLFQAAKCRDERIWWTEGKALGRRSPSEEAMNTCMQEFNRDIDKFASTELLADREAMLMAISVSGHHFARCSLELRGDLDLALAALSDFPKAWQHVGNDLANDRSAMLRALSVDPMALEFARPEFKNDKEVVLTAMDGWTAGFVHASDALRGDREMLFAVLTRRQPDDGFCCAELSEASSELRANKEIALAAVAMNPWYLEVADISLKGDREVVLAALRHQTTKHQKEMSMNLLEDLATDFRSDREVVLEALRAGVDTLDIACPDFLRDKDFLLEAARRVPANEARHVYKDYYLQAADKAASWEEFLGASKSVLAAPGSCSPVLSVSPGADIQSKKGHRPSFEVTMMSGASFSFRLPKSPKPAKPRNTVPNPDGHETPLEPELKRARTTAPQAIAAMSVAQFAKLALKALRKQPQVSDPPESIFIVFADHGVAVTAWEWNRPLSDYL